MTGHRLLGLTGTVTLSITGACPEDCLTALAASGVRFRGFQKPDELTIHLTVSDRDVGLVRRSAKKHMCTVEILRVSGLIPLLRAMGMRLAYPVVLAGLVLLVFWLQGHIWFFSVSGNQQLPEEVILWVLEENGIHFWTKTSELNMNTVKNRVLADLPELSWITINTQGGMAQVVVREREEKPVISRSAAPANIVAKKSGLVVDISVTGGTAQVKQGSVVMAGDLLISGVTNLDKTMLLTRAEGEVYARTWNQTSCVLADNARIKCFSGRQEVRYSLTVGKKTINFYKTSGISYDNYDKIMESTVLTLPGGYAFPVTLTRTVFREYVPEPETPTEDQAEKLMETAAVRQLQQNLIAGRILGTHFQFRQGGSGFYLSGIAEYQEEIGSVAEMKD